MSVKNIDQHLKQYVSGSITLAVAAAITIGLITLVSFKVVKAFKQYQATARVKNGLQPQITSHS